jgi:hypothetical protein
VTAKWKTIIKEPNEATESLTVNDDAWEGTWRDGGALEVGGDGKQVFKWKFRGKSEKLVGGNSVEGWRGSWGIVGGKGQVKLVGSVEEISGKLKENEQTQVKICENWKLVSEIQENSDKSGISSGKIFEFS